MRGNFKYTDPKEKILAHILIDDKTGCWNWIGALKGKTKLKQYGHLVTGSRVDGSRKSMSAHRYSYQVFKGDIGELFVCHKCDNPKCVNPDHLFLGTRQDNVNDREVKGRNKIPNLPFESHSSTKLKIKDIYKIRDSKESSYVLAIKYNVTDRHIRSIKQRITWSKLPEIPPNPKEAE